MSRLRMATAAATAVVLAMVGSNLAGAVETAHHGGEHTLVARADTYAAHAGRTLTVRGQGFLGNDSGKPATLVSHTRTAHGSLTVHQDGSFSYTPDPGFKGTDSFDYTVSDAVRLYQTHLPPLATIDGVKVAGGAYGSSLYPVPGSKNEFYGLTDRGPNVDSPDGKKVLPLPDFTPTIAKIRMVGTKAEVVKTIPLRAADGTPYNGHVSTEANTGESLIDLAGNALPASPYGYDPEGLVALRDGTFWVSDEYGPYITHFAADGRAIERLSPFDGSLPAELANRMPNRGMEGLTITPDGSTLVGMMQSALQQPSLPAGVKAKNVTALRIVTYNLRTHATHEYVYLLDNPKTNVGAVSEITALSDTTFLVDERDGNMQPGGYKKLFKIDISGATDVGPSANVQGSTYDGSKGGLLVGQDRRTIEAYVGEGDTATAQAALKTAGITPVTKTTYLDLGALVTGLDPAGGFFGHDKIEGVATTDGGRTVVISNDNDFGIDGVTNDTAPYTLHRKTLPDGRQDDGAFLAVDTTRLPAATSTAKVTIQVR
ncbi:esterase-like activity of phytase family protein [Streptomyces acidicola]|uniref:Esterase-like activity of phytase family protein n=1 Tax=Streptomyces acidicola TaxID=2596892 RepID=A0A5N8WLC4_9ACTN|nr:esterase-like activity of phytase family protein [Streptomyces acidicola]MPY47606.1 esterase-like activity of phytase family protein [Streptomyces acidicola]